MFILLMEINMNILSHLINQNPTMYLEAPYLFKRVLTTSTYSCSAVSFDFPFWLVQAAHLGLDSIWMAHGYLVSFSPTVACL